MGLGLSLTKRIVEYHKGIKVLQSEIGKGTTMQIVFKKKCKKDKVDLNKLFINIFSTVGGLVMY
jgi:signal transduction histidine kinase